MPANIRVGGVRVDFSADASRYHSVAGAVNAANRRLDNSYRTVGRSAASQSRLVNQFTNSLQSSLIATIAYAAGVRALISVTAGSIQTFLDWEKGLIAVQKTTGLTDEATERLGTNFERLLTRTSALNRPLPVTSKSLLEIAEVAGQMNIRGVPNITRFTETVALMGLTTDLVGREAANALGLIITNTDATVRDVGRVGAVLTALGNRFRGGERDIISLAEGLARSTAEFDLSAKQILAYSAVLAQAGSRQEKAGTVFQRTIRALFTAANEALSGQPERLQAIANATDNADESYSRLVETIQSGDIGEALNILLQALENLQSIGTGQTRGNLLTLLFGGDQGPPVRIAEIIGVLTKNLPEINRALAITNREWDRQIALLEEAGLFAEARAARLVVVQNQLQEQGKAVGDALSAVFVPVAENFKVVELAIVGAGTALASRFAVGRINAIRDSSFRFTRALQLQEEVSRSAARSAQIDAISIANANRAANVTGFRRIILAENLAKAELRAAAATRIHSASVLALSRANRIAARAARAASAALAFVGGPIGLITTALSLGATAWLLWGRSADDATTLSESLPERLKRLTEEANNTASGLSASERALVNTGEEIARLNARIQELRNRPDLSGITPRARPSIRRSRLREAEELEREIEELESLSDGLRSALEGVTSPDISDGLGGIASRFKAISLSIEDPTRQVRDFITELERATEIATRRARFDLAISPLPQFDQDVLTASFERRAEIQEQNLELERDLNDAIQDQGRASALAAQTKARRDQFAIGTDDRKEAERQVERADKQLEQQNDLVESRRQALAYAKANLNVDNEALETQIRAQILARNVRALTSPLTIEPADLREQENAAADFVRQLELQADAREREASQLDQLARLRRVDRAALEARFDVLNRFSDAQIKADEEVIRAEENLVETRRRLAEVTASLSDTEDTRDQIEAARQRTAEAERALAEIEARRDALERLGNTAIGAAEAEARAARRIAQIQIESADLLKVATDLAESGVRGIEDALVSVSKEGVGAFGELANGIVSDLLRIIYRATIAVSLLRALGIGAGGELTGGGLLGRIGLGGGSNEILRIHEGGIAGEISARHRGPIMSNERLAVLEKGEEVIPQSDPRHRYNFGSLSGLISRLPRYHEGGIVGGSRGRGPGGGTNLRIELINRSQSQLEITQTTQRYDQNQLVASIILEDTTRDGPITKALRQRSEGHFKEKTLCLGQTFQRTDLEHWSLEQPSTRLSIPTPPDLGEPMNLPDMGIPGEPY